MSLANSWLGDGANDAISAEGVMDIFDADKLSSFASQLGLDQQVANEGLAGMLPDLVNENSSGGSLLDAVGGIGGAADLARKLF